MTPQEGHWGGFHHKSCRKVDPGPPERTGTLGPVGGWPEASTWGPISEPRVERKPGISSPLPRTGSPPPRWACWKLQPRGTVLGACGRRRVFLSPVHHDPLLPDRTRGAGGTGWGGAPDAARPGLWGTVASYEVFSQSPRTLWIPTRRGAGADPRVRRAGLVRGSAPLCHHRVGPEGPSGRRGDVTLKGHGHPGAVLSRSGEALGHWERAGPASRGT